MSHFVPLKASSLPRAQAGGSGFVPKILPKGDDAHGAGGCSAGAGGNAPKVELIRDGDRVIGLTITCSCGQVHEFDCEYPSS